MKRIVRFYIQNFVGPFSHSGNSNPSTSRCAIAAQRVIYDDQNAQFLVLDLIQNFGHHQTVILCGWLLGNRSEPAYIAINRQRPTVSGARVSNACRTVGDLSYMKNPEKIAV
jgi:hypothetical protein